MPELCIPNTEVHTRDFFLHKIDVEHLDVSVGPPKHLWLGQYNEYIEVVYKYFCETCTGSTQLIYGAFNLKSQTERVITGIHVLHQCCSLPSVLILSELISFPARDSQ